MKKLAAAANVLASTCPGGVGGNVPATLSLVLGQATAFGPFRVGQDGDYTASTTATVISTAGDAALSVADPSADHPGHLVNGTFFLPSALQARANGGAFAALSGTPLALWSWSAPVSNDVVTLDLLAAHRAQRRAADGDVRQDADVHAVHNEPRSACLGARSLLARSGRAPVASR